ncbi:biotin/lipoate A/B protein ligase family protein [Kroppenstedtia eburnea]|uniref:Octanoyltransferase LipM n=1 Tax=Kroppenstedtia eburnea TaxID=714067 RepID=A0A1N7IKN9_9BACL|nr:biotin/lipoate A/B protein ligase family protein [Kroppenstedtia eburnea]QKI81909.1 lipoate--protein ligase family protein [Kroppenstedtia eburnea]SIS37663.1 lipoate-protein ligase A [Kroppenstedtia eburnea]
MTANNWRLLHTGNRSSAENMAIDEAILTSVSEGEAPPTLRFYGWEPATLSIGYFQKVEKEVNRDRLRAKGLGLVRRPTGGRAVLHDREVTYSVILAEDYPGMPTSVTDSYRVISTGLLEGFRELDLQAEMVPLETEEEKAQYASLGSAACFDSPSNYELVVEGRKVAGSAQTRQRGVILQHGSILLDLDVDLLFDVLRFPSERVKERMKRGFLNKAVAINQLRPEPVSFDEAVKAMTRGFEKGLQIRLEPGELTPREQELAQELVSSRYGRDEWNFKK